MRLWFVSPHAGDEWINRIKVAKEMEVHWLIDRNVRFDISCFALTWSRSEEIILEARLMLGNFKKGWRCWKWIKATTEVCQGCSRRTRQWDTFFRTHLEGWGRYVRIESWRMCPIALYGDYILGRPMNWTVGTVDSARFQAPCRPILHLFTLGIIVGETPFLLEWFFKGRHLANILWRCFTWTEDVSGIISMKQRDEILSYCILSIWGAMSSDGSLVSHLKFGR